MIYTREQHQAISRGWAELIAFAQEAGAMSEASELNALLTAEKRITVTATEAKASLLSALVTAKNQQHSNLWLMPEGRRSMTLYAWHVARRPGYAAVVDAADEATQAHVRAKIQDSGVSKEQIMRAFG